MKFTVFIERGDKSVSLEDLKYLKELKKHKADNSEIYQRNKKWWDKEIAEEEKFISKIKATKPVEK